LNFFRLRIQKNLVGTIKKISIILLDNFLINYKRKKFKITPSGKKRSRSTGPDFVQILPLKEFKDNKALNDQGKDEGTIIVTAQLNLNMSWSLT
jgi:hypothetical protein